MIQFDKDKLAEVLRALGDLPKIKEVRELQKRLLDENKKLTTKATPAVTAPATVSADANAIRSAKLHRYWRYIKLIRDNFPNLKTNQIRSQLKERRQGNQVQISDAIWQNPSP